MPLTTNRDIDRFTDQELRSVPLAAGARIHRGALVEWNAAGYARPVTGTGLFAGLAYEQADNTAGTDGDTNVRVYTLGDFAFPLPGTLPEDVGRPAYALTDDYLTLHSQSATFIGMIVGHARPGEVILRFQSATAAPAGTSKLEHHPTSFNATSRQSGTLFTNLGSSSPVTVSLPPNAPIGTMLKFVCLADQPFRFAPGTTGGIYVRGAKQPDNKYAQISDIGDFVHLVADGNGDWIAEVSISGNDTDIVIQA